MPCTPTEIITAIAIVAFVAVGLIGTWILSGFTKALEIRHWRIYELLGRPKLTTTSESTPHAVAMITFVLGRGYKRLDDPELVGQARALRTVIVISFVTFLLGAISMVASPDPQAALTFACLRGQ